MRPAHWIGLSLAVAAIPALGFAGPDSGPASDKPMPAPPSEDVPVQDAQGEDDGPGVEAPPFSAPLRRPVTPRPRLVLAEPERLEPMTEVRLRAHLEARAAALRNGDEETAELALGLLEEAKDALGARNAVTPAAVLLEEAKVARARGDLGLALARTARALRLAPDLLAAHWLKLNLLVEEDAFQVARIARSAVRMGRAWTHAFRNQIHLLTLVTASVLLGLVAAVCVLAVSLLARHLRYQAYDLSRDLPKVIGSGEMALLLVLLVLLPGAFGLGWPTSLALALSLTLAYQSPFERMLSVAGVAAVSAAPWLAALAAPLLAFHGSRVDQVCRVLEETMVEPAEGALKTHLARHPDDALTALVLGIRAARRSDYGNARALLEKAVVADPSDPVINNNLGVVEYRVGNHESAEQRFFAAAEQQVYAEPALNLSLLAAERGDFEEAERQLRSARRLGGRLIDDTLGKAGLPTGSRLSLIPVETSRLWSELYRLDQTEVGATSAQLWRFVGGRVEEWSIPAWGLLSLAVGLLGFRTADRSHSCRKCGAPATREHCTQCQSVFVDIAAVPPGARALKEREVRIYQRVLRSAEVMASFVPGLPLLFGGRAVRGFFQLLVFTVLMSMLALRGGLAVHGWHVPGNGGGQRIVMFMVVLCTAGLSLMSLRRVLRR